MGVKMGLDCGRMGWRERLLGGTQEKKERRSPAAHGAKMHGLERVRVNRGGGAGSSEGAETTVGPPEMPGLIVDCGRGARCSTSACGRAPAPIRQATCASWAADGWKL